VRVCTIPRSADVTASRPVAVLWIGRPPQHQRDGDLRPAKGPRRSGLIQFLPGEERDRAEELIQRLWLTIELDIVRVVGPLAEPELVEKS
jgi:hypothetical protein